MTTHRKLMIYVAGIALILGLVPVAAQDSDTTPDPGEQPQHRQQLREQIRERIHQDPALDPQQRQRMEQNLERCLRLGLDDAQVEALFPMDGREGPNQARHMLQWQERVMTATEEGLAEDLLTDKLREGRMKGVDPRGDRRCHESTSAAPATGSSRDDPSRRRRSRPQSRRRYRATTPARDGHGPVARPTRRGPGAPA